MWCSVVIFQSPPKGATIPYRPKPQVGGPVILAGGQAYTIQGNYAVPAHSDVSIATPISYLGPVHGHAHTHPLAPPPLGQAMPTAAALPPLFAFDPMHTCGQLQPILSPQLTDVSGRAPVNIGHAQFCYSHTPTNHTYTPTLDTWFWPFVMRALIVQD